MGRKADEEEEISDVFGDLLTCNWRAFWVAVDGSHSGAALVWDERCRAELAESLEAEAGVLRRARERVAQVGREAGCCIEQGRGRRVVHAVSPAQSPPPSSRA